MVQFGTVVNGVIVPEGSPPPEGMRFRLVAEDDDSDEAWDAMPPPPATETREGFLQSLRDSIAAAKAGESNVTRSQSEVGFRGILGKRVRRDCHAGQVRLEFVQVGVLLRGEEPEGGNIGPKVASRIARTRWQPSLVGPSGLHPVRSEQPRGRWRT